jgi:hypothetical protein
MPINPRIRSMNISITPTAEAIIQQLLALGYEDPETVVEQALKCFQSQQAIDTTLGFPDLTEAEITQDNEARWQSFQQNPEGFSQAQVEARFSDRSN